MRTFLQHLQPLLGSVPWKLLNLVKFGEITQNKGNYAVQGHSRSQILEPIDRKLIYNFLSVISTNSPPILHRF